MMKGICWNKCLKEYHQKITKLYFYAIHFFHFPPTIEAGSGRYDSQLSFLYIYKNFFFRVRALWFMNSFVTTCFSFLRGRHIFLLMNYKHCFFGWCHQFYPLCPILFYDFLKFMFNISCSVFLDFFFLFLFLIFLCIREFPSLWILVFSLFPFRILFVGTWILEMSNL